MSNKIDLHFAEFYITNVCNLTCTNCNRFNNYNVKGRVEFDYELYKPWADKVDFSGHIGILGGEPLLHPNLKSWVEGIRSLWPNAGLLVTSNGTMIARHKGLYEFMLENRANLEISFHNPKVDEFIWAEIEKFKSHCHSWEEINDSYEEVDRDGNPITINTRELRSADGFRIFLNNADHFQRVQFASWEDGHPIPHITDPKQAWYVCGMKYSHTFHDGKLYKCGFMPSVMQYFSQYGRTDDWDKVYEYKPHIDVSDIDRLREPEDVCSLCPAKYVFDRVESDFK